VLVVKNLPKPEGLPKRIWDQLTDTQRSHYWAAVGEGMRPRHLDLLLKSLFPAEPRGYQTYG